MPGLLPALKDGASWAALEYSVNIRGGEKGKGRQLSGGGEVTEQPSDVVICVAGINFTDKTKYRSSAIMQYVTPPCSFLPAAQLLSLALAASQIRPLDLGRALRRRVLRGPQECC